MNIIYLLFGFSLCFAQTPYPTSNTSVYGSAVQAYDLNNIIPSTGSVSTSMFGKVAFRFKAQHTGSLSGIRVYIMGTGYTGYGAGNGGTWRVTLRHDSTANHTPAQTYMRYVVQSMATYGNGGTTHFPLFTFDSPASVDSGTVYHIVFENIDADQANNYSSVNTFLMFPALSPQQPFAADADWSSLVSSDAPYTTWKNAATNTPIMSYYYSDGYSTGMGYLQTCRETPHSISGNAKLRETFTVTGKNRIVSSASVWLKHVSGTDALTLRLEKTDGTLLEQGTIAAASIPTTTNTLQADCSWATLIFKSNQTLIVGQSYNLVFSTASGSSYSTYLISDGSSIFGPTTCFSDGRAQITADGNTWSDLWSGDDLSFYFKSAKNMDAVTLPVQVTSFTGLVKGNTVALDWNTATEVNSYMFEIERRTTTQWESIGQIPAGGTSNAPLEYRYEDSLKNVGSGSIFYRLKLINNDGSFQYSDEVEVLVTTTAVTTTALPNIYALSQNYPNPFNPTTTINYQLQKAGTVSLKVYDMLGREVATLVNGNKGPGYYSAIFDASRLSSGTYIYRLNTDSFTEVKKLVLLK